MSTKLIKNSLKTCQLLPKATALFFLLSCYHLSFAQSYKATIIQDEEGAEGNLFGAAVAVHGNFVVVGSPLANSDTLENTGRAQVYERFGTTDKWIQRPAFIKEKNFAGDEFGASVALFGDFALVGAPGAYLGNFPGSQKNAGVVYVYQNSGLLWNRVETIHPQEVTLGRFGESLSLYANYALIGAPTDSERGADAGAIYIYFKATPNVWIPGKRIVAMDGQKEDQFGTSVTIFAEHFAVGSPGDDDLGKEAGAVYIYKINSSINFELVTKILASDGDEDGNFGIAVAMHGKYLFVGAYDKNTAAGAVYIFEQSGENWLQKDKLQILDAEFKESFGSQVALTDSLAVISAFSKTDSAGTAYLFKLEDSTWTQETILKPKENERAAGFARAVAVDNDIIVIGSELAHGNTDSSGTVYIFQQNDEIVSVEEQGNSQPQEFALHQNYPNPFNPSTNIRFSLMQAEHIRLTIHDNLGREVRTVVDGLKTGGQHQVTVDMSSFGSGIYFYRLQAGNFSEMKKMIYLR